MLAKTPAERESVMSKGTKQAAKASKAAAKSAKAAKASQNSTGTAGKAVKAAPKSSPADAYRKGGAYWSVVSALFRLSPNKMHPLDKVLPEIKRQMGADGWKAYAAKDGKLSADERLIVACAVTARQDYGKALRNSGWETRWDGRAKEIGLYRL